MPSAEHSGVRAEETSAVDDVDARAQHLAPSADSAVPPAPPGLTRGPSAWCDRDMNEGVHHTVRACGDGTWMHRVYWYIHCRKLSSSDPQAISPKFTLPMSEQAP